MLGRNASVGLSVILMNSHTRTYLQRITLTHKPVFGPALACADRVQRERDRRVPMYRGAWRRRKGERILYLNF